MVFEPIDAQKLLYIMVLETYPRHLWPTDFAEEAELFWVVKNGIRMTGMPAWGPTHTDAQIWDLVAFMQRMPKLSPDAYRNLIINAQDDGHGHDHSEHNSSHSH